MSDDCETQAAANIAACDLRLMQCAKPTLADIDRFMHTLHDQA
jgi:hypothetical protein